MELVEWSCKKIELVEWSCFFKNWSAPKQTLSSYYPSKIPLKKFVPSTKRRARIYIVIKLHTINVPIFIVSMIYFNFFSFS
jgi:hypothetical protein